jgi:hypothetical protein
MNLLAVRANPDLLRSIINQTDEICKVAIDLDPHTLQYVHCQTERLCKRAIERDPFVISYVRDVTTSIYNFYLYISTDKEYKRKREQREEDLNEIFDCLNRSKEVCVICMEDDKDDKDVRDLGCVQNCEHCYCKECFMDWYKEKDLKCVLCRKNFFG